MTYEYVTKVYIFKSLTVNRHDGSFCLHPLMLPNDTLESIKDLFNKGYSMFFNKNYIHLEAAKFTLKLLCIQQYKVLCIRQYIETVMSSFSLYALCGGCVFKAWPLQFFVYKCIFLLLCVLFCI